MIAQSRVSILEMIKSVTDMYEQVCRKSTKDLGDNVHILAHMVPINLFKEALLLDHDSKMSKN